MNVLHLINYAGSGGTERYVENLLRSMHGKNCVRCFLAYNEDGPLVQVARSLDVPAQRIVMRSPYDTAAARQLKAYCRERDIDVVHTHFLRECCVACLAGCKRVVRTYHILGSDSAPVRAITRLLCGRVEYVANCTAGAAALAANGVRKDRIHIIYNSLDAAAWRADGARVRKELAPRGFVMLYAARLVAGKGYEMLARALELLSESTSLPFTLWLAGQGPLEAEIRDGFMRRGLGDRVRFLGHRTDMPEVYAAADLTVCPSESETLSYLLLESMAAGTPVLSTAVGGITDILDSGSHAGILVPPDDARAMADGMLRFMTDEKLRADCSRAAQGEVLRRFDSSVTAGQLFELYAGKKD